MTELRKTHVDLTSKAAPFAIRAERTSDAVAREALLDACFGDNRHSRTCQRLRDGRMPAEGLAFSAVARGQLVGTVRLWHVSAGGIPALILGPLAVGAAYRQLGVGAALMDHALAAAKARGHRAVLLLGDAPYYSRFGFSALKTGELQLPAAFERAAAGAGVGRWRARRCLGHDRADRRFRAQTQGSAGEEGAAYRSRGIGVATMRKHRAIVRVAARPRFRSTITTIMLILMTVMIVRDILVRRWGSPPPSPDVTRRLP
jgi:hypothetical protein